MDKKSIQHFAGLLVEFFFKILEIILGNITDLDLLTGKLAEEARTFSVRMVEEVLGEMNLALREDKGTRKELALVLKEKNRKRKFLTELGELQFERDYYFNKKTGAFEAPLDHMVGLEERTRIANAVSAKLVSLATEVSYAKSAEFVTGGAVSRQTVRNCIRRAPILEKEPEFRGKKQRVLEIYADEDHAHMQKPHKGKGKKSKIVPLVTVTEGTVAVSRSRNATVNPMHFVDENMDGKSLWESVEGFIEQAYDMDSVEKIRIHADGGMWIRKGLENYENVEFVLDGYHLQKRLRDFGRRFRSSNARQRLNKALFEDNRDAAYEIFNDLMAKAASVEEKMRIQEMNTYICLNWDAAVNRVKGNAPGSCTEGQVSHILSDRFSRNPMGWSEECLGKLSKLRVYAKNGGKIKASHFKTTYERNESYKEYAESFLEKRHKGLNYSWISDLSEEIIFDTASGTQQAIRSLGKVRNSFAI
ncbi:MAG: ISLre2 family transposase [Treponema sp.]|nr:ISLre2 family transposase [Treponema sp.]